MKKRKAKVWQAQRGRYAKKWTFRLVGDNGGQVAHTNQWYDDFDAMKETLKKYFPSFIIKYDSKR